MDRGPAARRGGRSEPDLIPAVPVAPGPGRPPPPAFPPNPIVGPARNAAVPVAGAMPRAVRRRSEAGGRAARTRRREPLAPRRFRAFPHIIEGGSHELHRPQGRYRRAAYPGDSALPAGTRARERPEDPARSPGRRRAQGFDRRHRPAGEPGRPHRRAERGWRRALCRGRRRSTPQGHAGARRRRRARCRPSGALPDPDRGRRARRALARRERRAHRHAPGRPGPGVLQAGAGRPAGLLHCRAVRPVGAPGRTAAAPRQRRAGAAGRLPGQRDRSRSAQGLRRHHRPRAPDDGLGTGLGTGLPSLRLAGDACGTCSGWRATTRSAPPTATA